MKCVFCKLAQPFEWVDAVFVVDGLSVCENHVDAADGHEEFGRKLLRVQAEPGGESQ